MTIAIEQFGRGCDASNVAVSEGLSIWKREATIEKRSAQIRW
jgi:hypothetical protein